MFSLSQKTEYAVIFLIALAKEKNKKYLSLNTISKLYDLPYRFLSVIAGDLKKAGIINSREGVNGGYYLIKDPVKISLFQVINLIEGETGLISCLKGKPCEKQDSCQLKKIWEDIQTGVEGVLKKYTLADLSQNC
jgi:Rrf2 family protein